MCLLFGTHIIYHVSNTECVCVCVLAHSLATESPQNWLMNRLFQEVIQFSLFTQEFFGVFFWMQSSLTTQHYFVLNTWTNSWCYNFLVKSCLHYSVPQVQKLSQIQHPGSQTLPTSKMMIGSCTFEYNVYSPLAINFFFYLTKSGPTIKELKRPAVEASFQFVILAVSSYRSNE